MQAHLCMHSHVNPHLHACINACSPHTYRLEEKGNKTILQSKGQYIKEKYSSSLELFQCPYYSYIVIPCHVVPEISEITCQKCKLLLAQKALSDSDHQNCQLIRSFHQGHYYSHLPLGLRKPLFGGTCVLSRIRASKESKELSFCFLEGCQMLSLCKLKCHLLCLICLNT